MTIMQARADRIKRYPFNEISGFSKMFYSDVRLAKVSEICLRRRLVLIVLKHIQLQSRSISIRRRQFVWNPW
jgi:hypothetical protein